MHKYHFPLQKLLEFRKIKENLAQKDFVEVSAAFREEEKIYENMKLELSTARNRANLIIHQGGAAIPALRQISEFIKGQEIKIRTQQSKLDNLKKLVESKLEILKKLSIEYKIIEKIKEKSQEEYKQELRKFEQAQSDEQSVLRHKS